MPWARLDDRFPTNRKVALLSDAAFRLYVTAICWSTENLTDGRIHARELRAVSAVRAPQKRAAELVDAGLWESAADGDGWVVHDFAEYQPTAEQVRDERSARAARQKRWRDKKKGTPPPPPPGDASRDEAGPGRPPRPAPPADEDRRDVQPAPIELDGFEVTDTMRRWCVQHCPQVDIEHSTDQFVSHFRSTGERRRSWPDAWQKWIREDARRGAGRPVQGAFLTPITGGAAGPRRSTTDDRVAAGLALAAELRAAEGGNTA